ncbi:Rz1-like lysis system protein LysC [Pseudomonas citronellolis]|uniref:Rz1-like lysis system protein LysC n=1 Tax=Pseudomonas citronellolis TaxID=53408 RepID=UPI0023E3C134|nr:Rz1-like lysis system protein LysC [Pseudomonas citronellolis]MDF3935356.1 Rz1-like lysis system protein LysC [Pseudomonas citronellolis]
MLAACGSAPPSPEQTLIETGCPVVVQCQLPATAPGSNGALLDDNDRAEAAWADCAAQVDMVYRYQQEHPQHVQAR